MRDTSLLAYMELSDISEKQEKVLEAIKENPDSTDRELTIIMGYSDPNAVRPRRKELLDLGLIESSGKRECTISKKIAYTWR